MIKVLFYHKVAIFTSSFENNYSRDGTKTIYPALASVYLKTYLEVNSPDVAANVQWLSPIQLEKSNEELIEIINREKPDLFCTGHYIWNHDAIMEQLSAIKTYLPATTKIVVGGPHIDVSQNTDFFKKYPFVDYAIYASGEDAFTDLVTSLVNKKKLIAFNTSNIAWYDYEKDKQIVADWKYVPQTKTSPYLANRQFFGSIIQDIFAQGYDISMPYELTRGCPYACTFCDWNSGFTNKTTRRKGTYQEEINLFQELGIKNIMLSDANVGQYDEDIDLVEYILEKNIKENAGFKVDANFSKLKKDNVLKMMHIMFKINTNNLTTETGMGLMLSVQDINEEVLRNIDRPDVGWDKHLEMAYELKKSYPMLQTKVQLIQGLPGQTLESWKATLAEVSSHDLVLQPFLHSLLPSSPAYMNPEYAAKWKPVYSNSIRYSADHKFFRGTFLSACTTFSQSDMVEMSVVANFYVTLTQFKYFYPHLNFQYDKVANAFYKSRYYTGLKENLYTNWKERDSYYFTVDIDLNQKIYSACEFSYVASKWAYSVNLKKLVLDSLDRFERRKFFQNKILSPIINVLEY
jgi:tRNA A37 methylthiotransferase MiaB